ncbi:anthranilate synthase component I [Alteribacillus iranensis]|uniref:Anthranilate synthase component 1 n=1 Tax=Alteribacillus iranensis TaxID=930128 RepID=A0A1I1ZQQ7_9BACI|nr:anthranilate synthase component I [Alteribacillus iranensis]SFE34015.1 anthranilate synthase, component I [Alteribacillus iranensis]
MSETSFASFQYQSSHYNMVPYVRRFFTDTITPIEMYQCFKEEAVFLLESKDEASPWSRYSFLGLSPQYQITDTDGLYQFQDKDGTVLIESEDLAISFDKAIRHLHPAPPEVSIPFKGGAVGVIPYDSVEDFETGLKEDGASTKEESVHLMFCQTLIALDHETKELTFIYYESNREADASIRYDHAQIHVARLMNQLAKTKHSDSAFIPPMVLSHGYDYEKVASNYPKDKFINDVEKIKEYIKAGDVFQAVLSQRFEKEITVDAFDIYRALRMINPSPYMFYLKLGDTEVVGSSPERLIQVQDKHLEIHPIAGTRKRGETAEEDDELSADLLNDEKEIAEHYMLVDLARNDVGRAAEYGSVETPVLLEIGKFSHVIHIISKVTGRLAKGIQPIEALQASFPAGTVSGAPKFRAMEILKELEPEPRGIYAGAVCYLGFDGNIDSCIAIRTMIVKGNKARVQAGAGIVADSVPEKEYEETQNKAAALLKAIEAAENMFGSLEEESRDDKRAVERVY